MKTDIVKETGLSEEAVMKLKQFKKSSDEAPAIDLSKGSIMNNIAQETLGFRQYTQPSLFTQKLISFMLTNDSFTDLVSRICAQNEAIFEYSLLHDVEKEIIKKSYAIALKRAGASKADNIVAMDKEYRKAVYDYMIKNMGDIQKRLPISFVPGAFETIYIDRMSSTYHLARMTAKRTEEMNNFLNSKDLFDIVADFMKPISQYR